MKKNNFSLHPFLFTVYPILYLYAKNIALLSFSDIVTPIVISLGVVSSLSIILHFGLKNIEQHGEKISIFLSVFLVFFFSYGHFSNFIRSFILTHTSSNSLLGNFFLDDYAILSIFILMLVTPTFFLVSRIVRSNNLTLFNDFLNATSFILVIVSVLNISFYEILTNSNVMTGELLPENNENSLLDQKRGLPDIYYIVLDGYGRKDVLKEVYGYNNNDFIGFLEDKGFYVAHQSRANYCQSCLSVASFLNLKYINYLGGELKEATQDRSPLVEMIKKNEAAKFLKKLGYKFINFPVGYFCINESPLADVNISFGSWLNDRMFEKLLVETTVFEPFMRTPRLGGGENPVFEKREKVLHTFKSLEEISEMEAPTFVYAHIMVPHPPFVFSSRGEPLEKETFCFFADGDWWQQRCGREEDYILEYRDQLTYTNYLVRQTVNNILAKSDFPPVIILQADHGPGAQLKWESPDETNIKERMGILNAYYLPGGGDGKLYDSITPVNSLRVIFNYYFGTEYKLLEDKSYFSTWSQPYKFIEV
jgi:hypothetical protein